MASQEVTFYRAGGIVPTDLPSHNIFVWRRAHDEVQKEIDAADRPRLENLDLDSGAIWGVSYDELKDMEESSRALWKSFNWWRRFRHRREYEEARWLAALAAQRAAACHGLEIVWR